MLGFQGIRGAGHSRTEQVGQGPIPEDPNPTAYDVNASAGAVRTHDCTKGEGVERQEKQDEVGAWTICAFKGG